MVMTKKNEDRALQRRVNKYKQLYPNYSQEQLLWLALFHLHFKLEPVMLPHISFKENALRNLYAHKDYLMGTINILEESV